MMKQDIQTLILKALEQIETEIPESIQVDRSRDPQHGEYATNIALILTKAVGKPPRELAQSIVDALPKSDIVEKVEIAGPGFINFFLTQAAYQNLLADVLKQAESFGQIDYGKNKKVHLEYVSANPTGPLHVGHGRGAAYGDALGNVLKTAGFKVHREYYVNDAGRQMNILATSIWLRYLALLGEEFAFPRNGYKGDYVIDIAKSLQENHDKKFLHSADEVFQDVPADETDNGDGDKEAHIDGLIQRAKKLLGEESYQIIFQAGLDIILNDIRDDLAEFRVEYDEWFSEKSLFTSGATQQAIEALKKEGHTYERDGALWFNAVHFGDEKDRVLVRANGDLTYFASDVAYHFNKFSRGFEHIIDILGADHHGYVSRIKSSMEALGHNQDDFSIQLVQFANLYRGKQKIAMSTRGGTFVTLRELRKEVGDDAARFFYVMRKSEQHMDFDLELAKSQTADNPVYYIQYAHARICSVMRQLEEKDLTWDQSAGLKAAETLTESHELTLLREISRYPEMIESAAKQFEPHQLAHYLRDLANHFHTYYNAHQFIVDDANIRNARLCLIHAAKHVIANGLAVLGVTAPKRM